MAEEEASSYTDKQLQIITRTVHEGIFPEVDLAKIANNYISSRNPAQKQNLYLFLLESIQRPCKQKRMIEGLFLGELESSNEASKLRGYKSLLKMDVEVRIEAVSSFQREIRQDFRNKTFSSSIVGKFNFRLLRY